MRSQFDFSLEGTVTRQADGDFSFARGDEQRLSRALKFRHMAQKKAVDKDGGPQGFDHQLDFRGHGWIVNLEILHHIHSNFLLFSRLDGYFLLEVLEPRLPDDDFMISGKKQELFRSFKLFEEAYVLPIDPNAGSLVGAGVALQLDFSQHFIGRGPRRTRQER